MIKLRGHAPSRPRGLGPIAGHVSTAERKGRGGTEEGGTARRTHSCARAGARARAGAGGQAGVLAAGWIAWHYGAQWWGGQLRMAWLQPRGGWGGASTVPRSQRISSGDK